MQMTVLDHIWANALDVVEPVQLSPLPSMLDALSAYPIVCLRSRFQPDARLATAGFANEEILPGATLADVLFEECGIEVSDDCIVYLETSAMQTFSDLPVAMLSNLMGEIVVKLATRSPTLHLSKSDHADLSLAHVTSDGRGRKQPSALVQ